MHERGGKLEGLLVTGVSAVMSRLVVAGSNYHMGLTMSMCGGTERIGKKANLSLDGNPPG